MWEHERPQVAEEILNNENKARDISGFTRGLLHSEQPRTSTELDIQSDGTE